MPAAGRGSEQVDCRRVTGGARQRPRGRRDVAIEQLVEQLVIDRRLVHAGTIERRREGRHPPLCAADHLLLDHTYRPARSGRPGSSKSRASPQATLRPACRSADSGGRVPLRRPLPALRSTPPGDQERVARSLATGTPGQGLKLAGAIARTRSLIQSTSPGVRSPVSPARATPRNTDCTRSRLQVPGWLRGTGCYCSITWTGPASSGSSSPGTVERASWSPSSARAGNCCLSRSGSGCSMLTEQLPPGRRAPASAAAGRRVTRWSVRARQR